MDLHMQFTQSVQPEIDAHGPLIYLWTISNTTNEVVGRYVGKAQRGQKRPTQDYVYNVDRLLQGKPYRTFGRDYRQVHQAMAKAVRAGHTIHLHYVCNVAPNENIYKLEAHYIREYGCFEDNIGLNSKRQQHAGSDVPPNRTVAVRALEPIASTADGGPPSGHRIEDFQQLVATHFPQLRPEDSTGRCSFYTQDRVRIVRAKQETPGGRVNIKLALTNRQGIKGVFNWDGTTAVVVDAIAEEIRLYYRFFKKK
jgi:hypothetical protein